MCGLVGIYTPHDPSPVDTELLQRMTDTLAHRGPDDRCLHTEPGLGLGFRRLAIIDLAGGRQPIYNEDRSLVLVCNGEIYNYRALREELHQCGHQFRAEVDVEVLVHLYEEEGPAFLERLNGQFALALYDRRRRCLLLARDPAGIAPLFYVWRQDTLLFASEIKALLEHPLVERQVNLTGLDQVLTLPGPVSPCTLFADVHSLPPGHYLCLEDGRLNHGAYWDLDYPPLTELDPTAPPALDELADRLRQAVNYRLQADVPVGFYLSGGLDSSLIAALIHDLDRATGARRPRHAFSIGFTAAAIDERRYQDLVVQKTHARHHTAVFDTQAIEARLYQAIRHAEAPLKESYNTCSLALSALVREHGLKVVLTGEGADELFGGYVGYRLDQGRQALTAEDFSLEAQLEHERRALLWGDPSFFYEKNYLAFEEVKTALYAPALAAELSRFDCCRHPLVDPARLRGRHPLHQRSYVDFKLRLADHLLADHGDRVGYAHSVEARYPFLDPAVIDWVRRTPPHWLVHDSLEKYPLRQVAARYLPDTITRREKFGFVAPSCAVLLRDRIEWVEDLLSYATIRQAGYFNPDTVERLKTQYRQPGFNLNTTFDTDLLMIVLTFEIFRQCFGIPCL
jgi:asparagine synthase (glutamine-hydrolysing)